jgi:8-oxo-dGTP pyrophosphatase MutT (NUDIX family)
MAPFTSIAGQWLFPCGTPDHEDVSAGMLDLAGSARRELFEETGLDIGTMQVEAGWTLVRDNGFVALIKQNAEDLRARIVRYLARRSRVRGVAYVDADTPRFLRAYLAAAWSDAGCAPS